MGASDTVQGDSEAPTVVDRSSATERSRGDVRLPPRIGRYTLIRKLGEGGMGAVYVAYDEELDRRVALKLLHVRLGDSESVQIRMQREAQALARMNHPNVVQIYDVGRFAKRLYVAMELVDGCTLREYCRAKPRPWREVLALMLQAGEGLAAAHGAGLIHRDIKPDNILVGGDGRVRVADFGLARSSSLDESPSEERPLRSEAVSSSDSGLSTSPSPLDSTVTVPGTLLGTPAYMAPEQHMRRPVDARADVFSFCVVLYEALYGCRPFSGKTRALLTRAIMVGNVDSPSQDPPIPAWLLRLIRRGLVADPRERIPSMEALLVDLRRDPHAVRARGLRWAGIGALVIGAALGGAAARSDPVAECVDIYADLDRTLAEKRAAVGEALGASATGLGATTWTHIMGPLGTYADELHGVYSETCEGHRRGRISDSQHALKTDCLDRRHRELVALLDLLAEGEKDRLEHAVTAVAELPPLSACLDLQSLLAEVAPPKDPGTAASVDELRGTIDQLRAMRHLGEFLPAQPLASEAVARARSLDYPPVLTEALVEEGLLAAETSEHGRAMAIFSEALVLAERTGDDHERLRALGGLLSIYGYGGGTLEGMRLLVPQGRALAERRELQGDVLFGRLLVDIGHSYMVLGEPELANDSLTEALAVFEDIGPKARVDLARAANGLALLRTNQGLWDEAHALYERSRGALVGALGEQHPHVGHLYNNEARVYESEGLSERAREDFEAALAIWAPAYGEEHENVEIVTSHLARVTFGLGDFDAAKRYAERSIAVAEARGGVRKTNVVLLIAARVEKNKGRLRRAENRAKEAQLVITARAGEDSPRIIEVLEFRAEVAVARSQPERATELLRRAISIATADRPEQAAALSLDLAKVLWDSGEPQAARERAIAALGQAAPELAPTINIWLTEHPL